MRSYYLQLILIILNSTVAFGQDLECYCYENDSPSIPSQLNDSEGNYVEWLIEKGDSIIVLGYLNRNCNGITRDFIEKKFKKKRAQGRVWIQTFTDTTLSFTKILENRGMSGPSIIKYHYTAKVGADGSLHTKIRYTPESFTDRMGPPDRVYRKVDL